MKYPEQEPRKENSLLDTVHIDVFESRHGNQFAIAYRDLDLCPSDEDFKSFSSAYPQFIDPHSSHGSTAGWARHIERIGPERPYAVFQFGQIVGYYNGSEIYDIPPAGMYPGELEFTLLVTRNILRRKFELP